MNFEEKKNAMILLLKEYVDRPVIMKNQAFPRPVKNGITDYPFIAYAVISHRIAKEGKGNYSYTKEADMENSLIAIKENQIKSSFSFSCYSKSDEESKLLCTKAISFFEHVGYEKLRQLDITVVDILNVSEREEFEVDSYEKISRFDVIFRTSETLKKKIETIETTENILKKVRSNASEG